MRYALNALLAAVALSTAGADPSLRAAPTKSGPDLAASDARDDGGHRAHGRVLLTSAHRRLGKIDVSTLPAAQAGAKKLLAKLNGNGKGKDDDFVPKNNNKHHLRFAQTHGGMEVEGAALVVHADADGNVVGVNGEQVPTGKLTTKPTIGAGPAIQAALEESRIPAAEFSKCAPPKLTVVRNPKTGTGHLAWTCTVRYDRQMPDGSYKPFKDQIFAAATGEAGLVALFPRIYSSDPPRSVRAKAATSTLRQETKVPGMLKGTARKATPVPRKALEKGQRRLARSMETRDCGQSTKSCGIVSTSSNTINTGDLAIDSAHNYAIATYNYFFDTFGRDSIDGNGMTLISRVHYDRNYNNAFWDGSQMTYGDGDGTTFDPLSQDADVVAHELTHGVTERTSNLIYQNESGALNEAMSDIFGALVDKEMGASETDTWLIGEDIYTPGTPGDALRSMADPAGAGDYDYYPTRYQGTSDNGGVHWNSGIANLAFKLLVTGGTHPRGKTSVVVPSIGFAAAAEIFYNANVACLTAGSTFADARHCTADVHGGADADKVHLAWDAVGVPYPPPPNPVMTVENGSAYGGQSAATGNLQSYTFSGPVSQGATVRCVTSCNNGDLDLFVRFGAEAQPGYPNALNDCGSYSSNSNEDCTTGQAPEDTMVYATLHAYTAYTNAAITCTVEGGVVISGTPSPSVSPTKNPTNPPNTPNPTDAPTSTPTRSPSVSPSPPTDPAPSPTGPTPSPPTDPAPSPTGPTPSPPTVNCGSMKARQCKSNPSCTWDKGTCKACATTNGCSGSLTRGGQNMFKH